MRFVTRLLLTVGGAALTGCATQHFAADTPNAVPRVAQQDTQAVALAFDPAITFDQPQLNLDRDAREPAAFAGYDEPTLSYSYLRSEDRIDGQGNTYLDRDAVTYRVGVTTR